MLIKNRNIVKHSINERYSNFELYRIIVMFFILCGHYIFNSGLLKEIWGGLSVNSIFYYAFGIWGKAGINCFVMLTGFFMCKSNITIRKFLKLLLQIEFYNIIIATIFLCVGYGGYDINNFFMDIMPIQSINTGFVSCFLCFYLLIPFLNILINAMSRRMHLKLVILLLVIYCVFQYLPQFNVTFNYISWFTVLYLVASYIRIYPQAILKNDNVIFWGGCSILLIGLAFLSVLLINYLNSFLGVGLYPFLFILDSNALFAFLIGVSSFLFFKNLKIRNSRIINTIASTTFGVLLIHANSETMREWLWVDLVDCVGHVHTTYYPLYFFIVCIGIFIVCSFIDYLRGITVERLLIKYIEKINKNE